MEMPVIKNGEPYPEIVGAIYDAKTIRILKDLYSSRESEMTAITTYVYQEIVTSPLNESVGKLFEGIGMVEMLHLELLGDAIVDFGGDPTLTSGNNIPWTSRVMNTTRNIKEQLQNDILSEQRAVAAYTAAANMVTNKSLADLLLRIAEDEMSHKKALEFALYNLSNN